MHNNHARGMAIGEVTLPLLTAFQRLIDLLDEPKDIPILAPIIQREIVYRLLVGDQGARLRQMASAGSQSQQIAWAIDWLKGHFTEPLRIEDLATQVNMSASTFHHHFRALTAMSPLQYQKWLRLNEARRLMLTERLDATSARFRSAMKAPPTLAESTAARSARRRYAILQTCERARNDFKPAIKIRASKIVLSNKSGGMGIVSERASERRGHSIDDAGAAPEG